MAKDRKKNVGLSDLVRRDGALALTFVNTGSRRSPRLRGYAELLRWSVEHGTLGASEAGRLEETAAESPEDAAAGFAAAEEWHALLTRMLNGRADGAPPSDRDFRELNDLVGRTTPRRVLAPGPDGPRWRWPHDPDRELFRPLWEVARSMTTLLTSKDFAKVRRCDGTECDVLFLANRPGHPRRWCDIKVCGAPLRSRKHYLRIVKPQRKAWDEEQRRRGGRPLDVSGTPWKPKAPAVDGSTED